MRGEWTDAHQKVWDDFKEYQTEFMIPEQNTDYWDRLIDEGIKLSKKYRDNPFVQGVILEIQGQLNRKAHERRDNG